MKKHAIIKCLHEQQITNYETLNLFLCNTPIDRIVSLVKDIQDIIEDCDSKPVYTPFMFLPNSDLSGIGGCNEITCKIKRAQTFSLFASLYADIVYLTWSSIQFEEVDYEQEQSIYSFVEEIRNRLALILTYEPLINAGIIILKTEKIGICRDCLHRCLTENPSFNLETLSNRYINQVSMRVYHDLPETISVTFSNLEDIVPHGHLIKIFPINYFHSLNKYHDGDIIQQKNIKKKLLNDLILESVKKSYLTAACAEIYNAKIITDVSIDVQVAQFLSSHTKGNKILEMDSYPTKNCQLPIIANASVEGILHLREEEQDCFNRYRNAVTTFLTKQQNPSIDLQTIYDQEIYPQLTELEAKIHFAKEGRLQKWLGSSLVILSTYGICAMGGLINSVGQAVSLFGGISNIIHGAQTKIVELLEEKHARKDNKYFFLWKLKNTK